jgi:phosphate transport system permease protein
MTDLLPQGSALSEDPLVDDRPPLIDPTLPLSATGNLRRRTIVNGLAEGLATVAALAAVAVLGIMAFAVAKRGGGALSWDFLTKNPPLFGGPGGGIAPAIVGTAVIVALATAIATPIGILVALYVSEFASRRLAGPIRLALDMLNGLPSIVIGLFVFNLLVVGHGQSGFAGAFALAIIMLPLIARSTQEMLALVPGQLRDAADALGVARWRSVLGIVLPSAMGGIVTGVILAVARAAGETAPLLILSSIAPPTVQLNPFGHALSNIPVLIFTSSEQADPSGFERAWGAAFVLLASILLTNIVAKAILARSRGKLNA